MGNGESTYDDPHDDFQPHPPSHGRSLMDTHHQPYNPQDDYQHHPPSHAASSMDTYLQPYDNPQDDFHRYPPHAESSMDTYYRHKQHATYIADNFSSLDQVFIVA